MVAPRVGPYSEKSTGKGHPRLMWKIRSAQHLDPFPDGGGYPIGFVKWALEKMGCVDFGQVLHMCSGSMLTGMRLDIRIKTNPDIVADCRDTPFPNESFDFILADPPYTYDLAAKLYKTEDVFPKPFHIMKEALRLLRFGGKFGILHPMIPMIRKPFRIIDVWGITNGCGYNIRAFTLMVKNLSRVR